MSTIDTQAVASVLVEQASTTKTPQFLLIMASLVDGKSWCGDCRAAEPLISQKFPQDEQPTRLTIHYAGDKETCVSKSYLALAPPSKRGEAASDCTTCIGQRGTDWKTNEWPTGV